MDKKKQDQNVEKYSLVPSEIAALCSVINYPELFPKINAKLFTDKFCIKVFKAMKYLRQEGLKIDKPSVNSRILNFSGGRSYYIEVFTMVPFNFEYHLKELKKCKAQRDMNLFVEGVKRRIHNPEEAVAYVNKHAYKLKVTGDTCLKHIKDVAPDVYQYIEDKSNGRIEFYKTGFYDLDRKIHPEKGDLMIIAARPSQGKTALMAAITKYMSKYKKVAIFSIEMSERKIIERLISSEAEISIQNLSKNPQYIDWNKLALATNLISNLNIYIEDTECYTVEEIRNKSVELKKEIGRLDVIVIDYLQLMHDSPYGGREQEIAKISGGLKKLARDMDCLVICLSQLSRKCEERPNKRPIMPDLRDSGSIEQDADIICFIYRDEYYYPDETEEPGIAEIIIGKNRNGPTGTIKLEWVGEFMKFKNIEKPKDF